MDTVPWKKSQGNKEMGITMMWKLAGLALAAAAIATAPIAGAAPDTNGSDALQRCTSGLCHARQVVANQTQPAASTGIQTALSNIGGPRARRAY
jgi:hypothetical protein